MNINSMKRYPAIRFFTWFITVFFAVSFTVNPAWTGLGREESQKKTYILIIDAGSSGSRLYIYTVNPGMFGDIPGIALEKSHKVEPGISEYEADEKKARENLEELLQTAKMDVPPSLRKTTPLYLLATAGMRMLSKKKRERIMKKVSDYYNRDNTFDFKTARVISGEYEGLYGWLAVNYLDDRFDPSGKREGILEMGGASTQIAYVPSVKFTSHKVQRSLRGKTYDIFTRSCLYMGVNQAQWFIGKPKSCFPADFPMDNGEKGTGDFNGCIDAIIERFNALCENLESDGPHCIFNKEGAAQKVDGDFFALSAFYYNFSGIGMDERIDLDELERKWTDFCTEKWKEPWDKLENQLKHEPDPVKRKKIEQKLMHLQGYCINTAYFWSLLKNGYGFNGLKAGIISKESVTNTEITWTLGAVLDIEMGFSPAEYNRN